MRFVLLTWNPGPLNDEQYTPAQWLDEMVVPLREGRPPAGNRWSIGTSWKSVEMGDQVCMLRQGPHGRGIVATGIVTKAPFRQRHWDARRAGDAWYVNVAWSKALDLNQMITIEELKREVTGFAWSQVYASGRIVDGAAARRLAELLGQGPPAPAPNAKRGQQRGTAEHNRLVELEAMKEVKKQYRAKGYTVRDVSMRNCGWDLEARRTGKVVRVEVKGATGPAPEFFLTPNEHRAAADQSGWIAVVITGIFGSGIKWHEFDGAAVLRHAYPTQYRVKP